MKVTRYVVAASLFAGLLMSNSADAQWSRNAATLQTYVTNTSDNVGIGTTNPLFKLDIQSSGNASMSFKSTSGNANVILDRFATNTTAGLNYRTNGLPTWQTGMINNDHYVIRNVNLGAAAVYCSYTNNYVGIGTTSPTNRLSVNGSANVSGFLGVGIAAPVSRLDVLGGNAASDTINIIQGISSYTGNYDLAAVYGEAAAAPGYGFGTYGFGGYIGAVGLGGYTGVYAASGGSTDTTVATGFVSYGVEAYGGPGYESNGILGQAGGGQYNYGVIGLCGPNYTPADSDNTHKNWAGYFFGDIVYSRAFRWSDNKLKNDIQPIESALEKLSKVQTSTYTFKTKEFSQLDLPAGRQMGFIAENMETVFPDLVKESRSPSIVKNRKVVRESVTFKTVNYEGIIPVIVAAVNEQNDRTTQHEAEMNARINQLENEIAQLKQMLLDKKTNATETGSLLQNVPNPAKDNTTISFYLPENSKGVLQINDANGKLVKSYNVNGSGMQEVLINTATLSNGSYTYSLTINGKVADSKTMVINK